jgi:glutathione S-transferase
MKLYYAETLNPRKVCAVARHVQASVEFVRLDLARGETRTPEFLALNPNGKVPLLQEDRGCLFESNAIMCRLSDLAGAELWPHDDRQVEVLRWLFWDSAHFTRYAGRLYFEYIIKPTVLGNAPPDAAAIAESTENFRTYAGILDKHLEGRSHLVGNSLTVADFAVAVTLPYAERAHIPLAEFPAIASWHERLQSLAAWREPFPQIH